jgi:hypothetical protein
MPTEDKIEYPNLLSRLILGRHVDRQFAFPLGPRPRLETWFLKWYEKRLGVDTRGIAIDRPIFLVGLPRSGTTMLQDILCSHPDMAYITNLMNECSDALCAAYTLCKRFHLDFKTDRFLVDSVEIELWSANEGLSVFKWYQDFYDVQHREVRIGDFPREQVSEWVETLKKVVWCFGGAGRRFFNKSPAHLTFMRLIKDVYPDAKIVYILRDPRACANSMVKLCRLAQAQEAKIREEMGIGLDPRGLFVPYPRLPKLPEYVAQYGAADIRTTANLWNDSIPFVEACADEVPFYTVRYEDILADPPGEISKILDFCELRQVGDTTQRFWDKVKGVGVVRHSNRYGSYEVIEEICRANMQRFGY